MWYDYTFLSFCIGGDHSVSAPRQPGVPGQGLLPSQHLEVSQTGMALSFGLKIAGSTPAPLSTTPEGPWALTDSGCAQGPSGVTLDPMSEIMNHLTHGDQED